jgi:uncharacterized membrane protein
MNITFHIKNIAEKAKAEYFFAAAALVFGLSVLFLTPPFQAPDEISHFYRAYQISEGHFVPVKEKHRVGGYVPESLTKITFPFLGICQNMNIKTSAEKVRECLKIPLNEKERTFVDLSSIGLYSPVSYLPQSFSIFFLRNLNLTPLSIFYGARIFTLLFWIICIFFAIRSMPFYKWALAFLALLPMSVFINMSLSADVAANCFSFLLLSCLLKTAYSRDDIKTKDLIFIAVLGVLLASVKVVYSPVMLLFLLIPQRKFKSRKKYFFYFIMLVVIAAGTIIFWSFSIRGLYIPYDKYNEQFRDGTNILPGVNMYEQIDYILGHGTYIFNVFLHSLLASFSMYSQGYIGTFGWLDTWLPVWFIWLTYSVLLLVLLVDGRKEIKIRMVDRLIIFTVFLIIFFLIILSQSLTWEKVGSDVVSAIQGRYLIPAAPLLFLVFYNSRFRLQKIAVPIIILFSLFSLSFTVKTIHKRYFTITQYDTVKIHCDAERTVNYDQLSTDNKLIILENGECRTSEKSRSGDYSLKQFSQDPVGFSIVLYDCKAGDMIRAEVWRLGNSGTLVLSGGGSGKDFYVNEAYTLDAGNRKWQRLSLSYTIPFDMSNKEVRIYAYNYSESISFFDDMTIEYFRAK